MKNIGFCAVYFEDQGKYTRWAIQDEWKHVGEFTRARVAQVVSDQIAAGIVRPGDSRDDLVREMLVDLVVEAATQMDRKLIPCRSFALMQHMGWPCFMIETGASSGSSIRPIESASWQEAGRLIDQLEGSAGDSFVRVRRKGDRVVVLSRDGGRPAGLPTGTLTGQLAALEKHLQNSDPRIPKGLKPFLNRSIPKIWHKF
ncbi:hypothetical protein ILT44_26955 [Microvirga sp. BT689]|uniref:hypothetical protein n=1 Tax=Microvirga arvi TaxID=2778731 RepID=UPI00194EF6BC|nr:hypothetical protein [Microvirga arvi]MBM6583844.1 hypothetical protein [Microvirga arvi]